MGINYTGRESEAISKHLNDTIEHYSDSMKIDYDRSGVISTKCVFIFLIVKLNAGRNLLIYLYNSCTPDKCRGTSNIGREIPMRTGESPGMLRNTPGKSGDLPGSVREFPEMLRGLSKVLRSIPGKVRRTPEESIVFPDKFRNFPGPVREFPGLFRDFPDEF